MEALREVPGLWQEQEGPAMELRSLENTNVSQVITPGLADAGVGLDKVALSDTRDNRE
jgi:hypothetical protein